MKKTNKRKIVNDPVHGFITIPNELVYDVIEHSAFQRLRRIIQLGLTNLVYPGALHTRFQHAIGALHLMTQAIDSLRLKGISIHKDEELAAQLAILLHDIGHGPYSHALEHSIVEGIKHEEISQLLMQEINKELGNQLDTAVQIFNNTYAKHFLHQLVSSQLDMDRLDYLKRDSFFTGVSEGVISTERIIKMLTVVDDELAVEEKGIYSIEKFIIARRLMYWQVYLHKTVLAAENMMCNILKRAKYLSMNGTELFATPALKFFLKNNIKFEDFKTNSEVISSFIQLDDFDILTSIKVWAASSEDKVLRYLCNNMVNRKLFRIELQNQPFDEEIIQSRRNTIKKKMKLSDEESNYLVISQSVSNNIYTPEHDKINILTKSGKVVDISEASDQLSIDVLTKIVKKHFLCYPKEIV